MRKDLKPSRETKVKIPNESSISSEEISAVCLEINDSELLVPFKIYRIKLRGEYVRVIDEKGEATVYPKDFFLPV